MKKAILLLFFSALFLSVTNGQKLTDIYKNGPVKLIPDKTYGSGNNWESLFNLYYDTLKINEREREQYKKIIVAPDGSVFMSHKNRHEIWKFGPDGKFLKRFGSQGGKLSQFQSVPSIQPVIDGKYIFTSDVNGRLKFFDLEGNYFKSISLKYMLGAFQPIDNGELLLEGIVMWDGEKPGSKFGSYKWRHIIVKLNIYAETEKVVFDIFENPVIKFYKTNNPDSLQFFPISPEADKIYLPDRLVFSKPVFTILKDGQFLCSDTRTGIVKVLDKNGKQEYNFNLDIKPVAITLKDAGDNYNRMNQDLIKRMEEVKNMTDITQERKNSIIRIYKMDVGNIERYKDLNNYYPYLPYFANIIPDDEGNLLIFEFTKKDEVKSNIFNVIACDKTGKSLARTSFVCDDYDLSFSESTFVISKGFVYAIAKLKNFKGMPLRLVRFKMSN